jgi:hypothetical protein
MVARQNWFVNKFFHIFWPAPLAHPKRIEPNVKNYAHTNSN